MEPPLKRRKVDWTAPQCLKWAIMKESPSARNILRECCTIDEAWVRFRGKDMFRPETGNALDIRKCPNIFPNMYQGDSKLSTVILSLEDTNIIFPWEHGSFYPVFDHAEYVTGGYKLCDQYETERLQQVQRDIALYRNLHWFETNVTLLIIEYSL